MGLQQLNLVGKTTASNIPVLGKGYVGVVVVAHVNGAKGGVENAPNRC